MLDTHVLLWWQAGGHRLSLPASRAIAAADRILVSQISCWEVAVLVSKGRIELDRDTPVWVQDLLVSERVAVVGLTVTAAVAAAATASPCADASGPAHRLVAIAGFGNALRSRSPRAHGPAPRTIQCGPGAGSPPPSSASSDTDASLGPPSARPDACAAVRPSCHRNTAQKPTASAP